MAEFVPYAAALEEYQRQADALFEALKSGSDAPRWRFKWEHPRFRGKSVAEVDPATLSGSDAQLVIAHQHGFATWADVVTFAEAVKRDDAVARFEAAVEAVISGDLTALRSMLRDHPDLARARSTRRHHATLLHYLGANGVEGGRQKTPPNAVDVAKTLLDAGAEVDALADIYDARCTTMSMLVSSAHPAEAGLQTALAETLLDYGAALNGPGSNWQSALMTALAFGYLSTAEALATRGAPVDSLPAAAGLGRLETAEPVLPAADSQISREKDPKEFGVVTIGAVQAGTVGNIIPDTATLRGTIRSYNPAVRDKLLSGVRRTANAAAMMAGAPRPDVALIEGGLTVFNSETVVTRTETVLQAASGTKNVQRVPPIGASEDFSAFINEVVPSMYFSVGVLDPQDVAESLKPRGKPLSANHSPFFAPVPEPSIKTSVQAMSLAVLNILMPR